MTHDFHSEAFFNALHSEGLLSSGIGLGAAMAMIRGAPTRTEATLAAQLAEKWPSAHDPGGPFSSVEVTKLHYYALTEAVNVTARLALIGATHGAAGSKVPHLDSEWVSTLTDPYAEFAGRICQASAERYQFLESADESWWETEQQLHNARQRSCVPVKALPVVPFRDLKYRLGGLWAVDFERAFAVSSKTPRPELLFVECSNRLSEWYQEFVEQRLGSDFASIHSVQSVFEGIESFNHEQSATRPVREKKYLSSNPKYYLEGLQWLNDRQLTVKVLPVPALAADNAEWVERSLGFPAREFDSPYPALCRMLPQERKRGWCFLLGDRMLESGEEGTRQMQHLWSKMLGLPAKCFEQVRPMIRWITDLSPGSQVEAALWKWYADEDESVRPCAIEGLATLLRDEPMRQLVESVVLECGKSDPETDWYNAKFYLAILAHVWPDDHCQQFMVAVAKDRDNSAELCEEAVDVLCNVWPDEKTRTVLEEVAGQLSVFEHPDTGAPRSRAMEFLAERWPGHRTSQLLSRVWKDDDTWVAQEVASELLMALPEDATARSTLESIIDAKLAEDSQIDHSMLEMLAMRWTDERSRDRIVRHLSPEIGAKDFVAVIDLLMKHWPDDETKTQVGACILDWANHPPNDLNSLTLPEPWSLRSFIPEDVLRPILEADLAKYHRLLPKLFPDTHTRDLLIQAFLERPREIDPGCLSDHFPDDEMLSFFLEQSFKSRDPHIRSRAIRALTKRWRDDAVRTLVEQEIMRPGRRHNSSLIAAYRPFASTPEGRAFLIRAIKDGSAPSDRHHLIPFAAESCGTESDELKNTLLDIVNSVEVGSDTALQYLACHWKSDELRELVEEIARRHDDPFGFRFWPSTRQRLITAARLVLTGHWKDSRTSDLMLELARSGAMRAK